MSKAGGYHIIDLGGKQLTPGEGMVFPGIYAQIEGTRKRIVFSGGNLGGTELNDFEAVPVPAGSTFVFTLVLGEGLTTITVTDEDALTVTVAPVVDEDEPTVPDDEI